MKSSRAIVLTTLATVSAASLTACGDGHKKRQQEACRQDPQSYQCTHGGDDYAANGGGSDFWLWYWLTNQHRSVQPTYVARSPIYSGRGAVPVPLTPPVGSSTYARPPVTTAAPVEESTSEDSVSRGGFGGTAEGIGGGGE